MSKKLLLDGFCCAGAASMGYHQAGFEVVGVDIEPQKNYPFEFHQGGAIDFIYKYGKDFDVIAASPPCQRYTVSASIHNSSMNHPDLVAPTRAALMASGKPYIMENVPGSPLVNPITLCGSMFNLKVKRHRLFETNPPLWFPPAHCSCSQFFTHSGKGQFSSFANGATAICVAGHNFCVADGAMAMAIDWPMTGKELSQAIPPAYTKWLGLQFMSILFPERLEATK